MLKHKAAARSKILLFALSILVFLVSAATVWNTVQLCREIHHRTLSYVSDVTDRLVKDIDQPPIQHD